MGQESEWGGTRTGSEQVTDSGGSALLGPVEGSKPAVV